MVGVILAAGDGTRLRSSDACKPLIKVGGVHLIEYALGNLIKLGVEDAYIVVGRHRDSIRSAIGDNYKGIRISYVHQPEQKGLINAFVQAVRLFEGGAVLQLADEIFLDLRAEEIRECISQGSFDFYCGITFEDNEDKIKNNFSVECCEDSVIRNCIEKPKKIINNIKGTGFCIFGADALTMLREIYSESENSPRELCDFMNILTQAGKKGLALCIAKKELNINTPSDLEEAQSFYC